MKTTRARLLLIGVMLLLTASFTPKKQAQPDYLIFGRFYKECVGGACMKLSKGRTGGVPPTAGCDREIQQAVK